MPPWAAIVLLPPAVGFVGPGPLRSGLVVVFPAAAAMMVVAALASFLTGPAQSLVQLGPEPQ